MSTAQKDLPAWALTPWFKWSWLCLLLVVVALSLDYYCRALPTSATGYSARGRADFDTGKFHDAVVDLSKAIERDPEDVYAYVLRAKAYGKLHDLVSADKDLEKALSLRPGFDRAYTAGGDVRASAWDAKGAIRDYSLAIEAEPNFGRNYLERGKLLYDARTWDAAAADLRLGSKILVESGQASAQLLLWMSRARGGAAFRATGELVDVVKTGAVEGSFFTMAARFLNDEMDEASWLATAVRIKADEADDDEQRAETYYVAAVKRLAFGDEQGAVPLLQAVLDTEADGSYLYDRARVDLEDLLLGFRVGPIGDKDAGLAITASPRGEGTTEAAAVPGSRLLAIDDDQTTPESFTEFLAGAEPGSTVDLTVLGADHTQSTVTLTLRLGSSEPTK